MEYTITYSHLGAGLVGGHQPNPSSGLYDDGLIGKPAGIRDLGPLPPSLPLVPDCWTEGRLP